ncbi:hypothetical protein LBMAG57_32090 [Verrucomicrobiota bacterium]|nr:hypothetical protein LBMAG57_32090 [Verrucomicrobiota bacterium]
MAGVLILRSEFGVGRLEFGPPQALPISAGRSGTPQGRYAGPNTKLQTLNSKLGHCPRLNRRADSAYGTP